MSWEHPRFVLYDELAIFLKKLARGTHLVHRHFVPDLGNELLKLVHSAHLMFALLGQHVRPYIKVLEIKVRGAGRPQSLIEKISQILPTPLLDDIRRGDRCAVLLKDVMILPEVLGPQPSQESRSYSTRRCFSHFSR